MAGVLCHMLLEKCGSLYGLEKVHWSGCWLLVHLFIFMQSNNMYVCHFLLFWTPVFEINIVCHKVNTFHQFPGFSQHLFFIRRTHLLTIFDILFYVSQVKTCANMFFFSDYSTCSFVLLSFCFTCRTMIQVFGIGNIRVVHMV